MKDVSNRIRKFATTTDMLLMKNELDSMLVHNLLMTIIDIHRECFARVSAIMSIKD